MIWSNGSFQILSAQFSNVHLNWHCVVQRLPLNQYPDTTDVNLSNADVAYTTVLNDFIHEARDFIQRDLNQFDAEYDGTSSNTGLDFSHYANVIVS